MEKQVQGAARPGVARGRERMVLSADLSELCRDLQETDKVLRELCEKRQATGEDAVLTKHYAEVWSKHRRLKQQVYPRLLEELGVAP